MPGLRQESSCSGAAQSYPVVPTGPAGCCSLLIPRQRTLSVIRKHTLHQGPAFQPIFHVDMPGERAAKSQKCVFSQMEPLYPTPPLDLGNPQRCRKFSGREQDTNNHELHFEYTHRTPGTRMISYHTCIWMCTSINHSLKLRPPCASTAQVPATNDRGSPCPDKAVRAHGHEGGARHNSSHGPQSHQTQSNRRADTSLTSRTRSLCSCPPTRSRLTWLCLQVLDHETDGAQDEGDGRGPC